jgi:hypothetical protein
MIQERPRLLIVESQSPGNGFFVIVGSCEKRLPVEVANAFGLARLELEMINRAARAARSAAAEALEK